MIRSNFDPRKFDQRIQFQRKTSTQDPVSGAQIVVWVPVVDCWASIDAIKAADRYIEKERSDQITASCDYTIWIRWRSDIDADMRIVWKGLFFNIRKIPDQQRRGILLALFCVQGDDDG